VLWALSWCYRYCEAWRELGGSFGASSVFYWMGTSDDDEDDENIDKVI